MLRIPTIERASMPRVLVVGAVVTWAPSGVLAQPSEDTLTQVQENFAQADANGDGSLTRSEFESFIQANADDDIGRAKTIQARKLYDRAFSKLDRDADGLVQRDEVKSARSMRRAD